jgi:hypothetical protein
VGLSKPLAGFVSQMLFGIQSSQESTDNIARSLKEGVDQEKRLSRNLKSRIWKRS